jgi:hypothetical protein
MERLTMITADQLLVHAIGDYVLQSDWMASKKRTEHLPAAAHAVVYSLPFVAFAPSWRAFAVIVVTHFLIDRFGLARYVVWAKNFLAPRWIRVDTTIHGHEYVHAFDQAGAESASTRHIRNLPWAWCVDTGYPGNRPPFLAVWLLIIADNILHVVINGASLRWL